MAYCTLEDILDAMDENDVIRYTDDDDDGVPDPGVIDRAIISATSLIDAHIISRYGAGMDPVPPLIVSLAVDIAVYKISSRKSQAPEDTRTSFEDAMALLTKIEAGKADIPGIDTDPETTANDTTAAVISRPQRFSSHGREVPWWLDFR